MTYLRITLKFASFHNELGFVNCSWARDRAVVAFVILVDGAGGGIMTGIDCVAGY